MPAAASRTEGDRRNRPHFRLAIAAAGVLLAAAAAVAIWQVQHREMMPGGGKANRLPGSIPAEAVGSYTPPALERPQEARLIPKEAATGPGQTGTPAVESTTEISQVPSAGTSALPGSVPRKATDASNALISAVLPAPTATTPIVSVKSFGAKGDGIADDTAAIQKALDSMTSGGTLEFLPGTYNYSNVVTVTKPNVKLWGYGATIVPTNEAANSWELSADNTDMYGFTINSPGWLRGCAGNPDVSPCYSIYVRDSNNHVIMDNRQNNGGGIILINVGNALIARNILYRLGADGIHLTGGTHDVRVLQNTVHENGDDMVAVFDYGTPGQEPTNSNILIEQNDLSGNFWGRGVAIAGGKNITVRNNKISKVTHNAGIYLTEEDAYPTRNVHNVLVEDNTVEDIQTTTPVYCPSNSSDCTSGSQVKTGQAGIQLYIESPTTVFSDIMIRNNTINRTYVDGINIGSGNISKVSVMNNTMTGIGGTALNVVLANTYCSGNTDDGSGVTGQQCTASSEFPVTGSRFAKTPRW